MKTANSGPPIIIPILLAVVGLGALATAIVLVPPMVDRVVEARLSGQVVGPVPVGTPAGAEATAVPDVIPDPARQAPVEVDAEIPVAQAPEVAQEPVAEQEPGPEEQEAEQEPEAEAAQGPVAQEPEAPASAPEAGGGSGKEEWVIEIDASSYDLDPSADPIIDEIIAALASDNSRRVKLTGINHPSKSSKRAVKAARVVKERIVADVGIGKNRVVTKGDQDPEVEGVLVRAELTGGAR